MISTEGRTYRVCYTFPYYFTALLWQSQDLISLLLLGALALQLDMKSFPEITVKSFLCKSYLIFAKNLLNDCVELTTLF